LANLTFLLPPLDEQIKALDFLEKAFAPILKTEQKLNLQIKKLQEYRQSLITAAVTGKVNLLSA
jgi:type I restriction enzyme S subunit